MNMVTVAYEGDEVDFVYTPEDAISAILLNARALFDTHVPYLGLFNKTGSLLPGMFAAMHYVTPGERLELRVAADA